MATPFPEAFDIGRSFSAARAAIERQPAGMILGGALLAFADMCSGGGNNLGNNVGQSMGDPGTFGDLSSISPEFIAGIGAAMAGAIACGCVLGLLVAVFKAWVSVGFQRMHEDLVLDGAAESGRIFSGADALGRMIGFRLLAWAITTAALIAALIPGGAVLGLGLSQNSPPLMIGGGVGMALLALPVLVYVSLGLLLGDRAVTIEHLGPTAALARGWELADGNRLTLFAFNLVWGLLMFAGFFACCIGAVPVRAGYEFALTEGFLLATNPELSQSAMRNTA